MKSEGWSQPIERAAERSIEASRRTNRTTALLCPLRVQPLGYSPACSHLQISERRGRVASIGIDPTGYSGHSLRHNSPAAFSLWHPTFEPIPRPSQLGGRVEKLAQRMSVAINNKTGSD